MWSFKNLLSLQIGITAGLPLLVIIVIGLLVIEPQLNAQIESQHRAVAIAMAGQVEGYLGSASQDLDNLRRMLEISPRKEWQSILDAYIDNTDTYSEILVANLNGITQVAGLPEERRQDSDNIVGIDLSRRIFFKRMKQTGNPTWSNTYLSTTTGLLTVSYIIQGQKFIITGEIELDRLNRFIEQVSGSDLMQIMVLDSKGALVAHPDPELTGQQLNLSNLEIVKTALQGYKKFEQFTFQRRHYVGMAIPIQPLGWIALVGQPYNEAYKSITAFAVVTMLALVLGLLLAGAGAIRLANWVAQRIGMFSTNAQLLSEGMYNLEWPESRVKEFNELGQHLRSMESEIHKREREIEDQRVRFQTAFETSPLAMSILNVQSGIFVSVNSAWTRLVGWTQEQATTIHFDQMDLWEDMEASRQYRDRVLKEGTVRNFENRLKRKSGEIAEVLLNTSKIVLDGIDHLLTVIVDVTESNRLNRELRETQILQTAILDNAGHAVISGNTEGIITTFNKAAEKMLGYRAEDMIGKQTPAIWHLESEIIQRSQEFSAELNRTVEPGFETFVIKSAMGLPNEHEWTYIRKDGSTLPVLLTVTAIRNAHDEITGYLGLAIDITDRKEAERVLRASELRLSQQKQAVVDLAHAQRDASGNLATLIRTTTELLCKALDVNRASVWSINSDLTEINCLDLYIDDKNLHEAGAALPYSANPAYFEALKHERVIVANDAVTEPATSKFAVDYLVPNNIGAMLDATVLRGSEPIGVVCFEHTGSQRVWTIDEQNFAIAVADFISLSMELNYHQHTSMELQLYKENLEELVENRTRELQAVNKELEAFSYSVSHDLRAPLRSIDGFSLALLEDYGPSLDDNAKDYLNRVRKATERMGLLIDDMLNLSRITRREMFRQPVDLTGISEEIVARYREQEPDRTVSVSIENGLEIDGDPNLLQIVMENLIGNAWKYTGKNKHASIEIGTARIENTDAIFVRDNGVGFDMTYSNKLFGAFQRLHTQEDFHGTGVGLATVNRIINRHGGRVWAEGNVNKGAAFYFTTS